MIVWCRGKPASISNSSPLFVRLFLFRSCCDESVDESWTMPLSVPAGCIGLRSRPSEDHRIKSTDPSGESRLHHFVSPESGRSSEGSEVQFLQGHLAMGH